MIPIKLTLLPCLAVALVPAMPLSAAPASAEIKELRLYTEPSEPGCGETVRLIAEIRTTKPGKVDFVLERRDGRSQKATVTTEKTDGGYLETWSRQYFYRSSAMREYRLTVKGVPATTGWVPVHVECRVGNG